MIARRAWLFYLTEVAAWTAAAWSILHFLGVWLAPDGCLDSGGSFDYDTWQCSDNTHQYREVPAYRLTAFWVMFCFIGAATALSMIRRRATLNARSG